MAPAEPAAGRATPGAWSLVAILCATHFTASMDRHLLTLVVSPVGAELGLSDTQLGFLLGTAYIALYSVAILPAGLLADRFDRRRILAAAMVLWSLGTVICALAQGFGQFALGRLVIGLGQAAVVPAAMSLIGDCRFARGNGGPISAFTASATLGRGFSLLGGGMLIAWLAATPLPALPADLSPWRALFLIAVVLNLGVLVALLWAPAPARPPSEPAGPAPLRAVLGARWRVYLAYLGCAAATILCVQVLAAWTPTLFVRAFGFSVAQSGLLAGGVALTVGPLGNLCGGAALDFLTPRHPEGGPARIAALGLAGAGCCAVLLCLSAVTGIAIAAFAGTIFFLGAATPMGLVAIQRLTPQALRGRVTAGFVLAVTLISLGIGPVAVGWMSDSIFAGPDGLGRAMLAVLGPAALVGIGFSFAAGRRSDRTRPLVA